MNKKENQLIYESMINRDEITVSTQKEFDDAVKNKYKKIVVRDSKEWIVVHGNSKVNAFGNSKVNAYGNSIVSASGNSIVSAYENSRVYASGNSIVYAFGNSKVYAFGNSIVTARDNSIINIYSKKVKVIKFEYFTGKINDLTKKTEEGGDTYSTQKSYIVLSRNGVGTGTKSKIETNIKNNNKRDLFNEGFNELNNVGRERTSQTKPSTNNNVEQKKPKQVIGVDPKTGKPIYGT